MTESLEELQAYLFEHIPISSRLEFRIIAYEQERVAIQAPFAPHVNHRNSVFGGSISALLIMAAWARARLLMSTIDPTATIVIQSSTVDFLLPIMDDFTADAPAPPEADYARLTNLYTKFGKARIRLSSHILNGSNDAARFAGDFVVLKTALTGR